MKEKILYGLIYIKNLAVNVYKSYPTICKFAIVYIVLSLASLFYNPWDIWLDKNTTVNKNNETFGLYFVDFIYYGISDLVDLMKYYVARYSVLNVDSVDGERHISGFYMSVVFCMMTCGMFMLSDKLRDYLIDRFGSVLNISILDFNLSEGGIATKVMVFLYDNVVSYVICIFMYFGFNIVYRVWDAVHYRNMTGSINLFFILVELVFW